MATAPKQTPPRKPSRAKLTRSIDACLDNAERLLEETYDLEFRDPLSTTFYLAVIAQEESAKGFLLFLVREEIIPLSRGLLRAMNDHRAKQLVAVILDYLEPRWDPDEDIYARITYDVSLGERLPPPVATAMNLLRYKKVEQAWGDDDELGNDPTARGIFQGKRDNQKQDALYVRLGADGSVASVPNTIGKTAVADELEHARRYMNFVYRLSQGQDGDRRYERAIGALAAIFEHARDDR